MKSAVRNFLSLLSADIVRRLLGFISVAYLARVLGTEGFGAINIGYAVLSVGIMVSAMGLTAVGAREIAHGAPDDLAGDIVSLRLAISVVVVVLICVISFVFVEDSSTAWVVMIFSVSVFAYAVLMEWYFLGKEDVNVMAVGRVSSPALNVLLLLLFVRSSDEILWVPVAAVLGDFLFAFILLRKHRLKAGRLNLRFRPETWRALLRQSVPVGLGYIFAQVTVNFPPLVLAFLMTKSDVGIFSAASKIVFYLLMVDRVLAPLLLPALTRWQGMSSDLLARQTSEVLRWLILVGLPIAVGGMMLAQPIVDLVFGSDYSAAAGVLRVFVWFFFLTIINSVYATSLLALGHNKVFGKVMFISAAIYVFAVTLLTMAFETIGTAFGIVFAEGITLVLLHVRLERFATVVRPKSVGKMMTATAVMAAVVGFSFSFHFLIAILVGAIVYGGAVLAMRAVTTQEILNLVRKA